uniref:Peroxin-19 n=2 Tax=Clastoptera arizonana TaxID=38151 RepID=A0A1B6E8B1_9HEMI
MDNDKKTDAQENKTDPELDSLLDSALEDFNKTESKKKSKDEKGHLPVGSSQEDPEAVWNDMMKKTMLLHSNLQSSDQSEGSKSPSGENFSIDFNKMADAAAQALEADSGNNEFTAAIAQTLKNLTENTENLQSQFGDPDDIATMFENLGLNATDAVGQPPEVFPFFQQIIQTFLSKEVLYPSMKELLDKYPAWLEENKEKISQEDLTRFKKQQKIMTKVCNEFEQESETDSEEVTERRFKKIVELMTKMQACGQPPQELMGNMTMSVDSNGMPNLPPGIESPEQCVIS